MKLPLKLAAILFVACSQHVDAQDSSINLESVANGDIGCGSTGGCTLATGNQVVTPTDVTPTDETTAGGARTAFGQFTYEFDAALSQMSYTTRVYDPTNAVTTFDVRTAQLLCLLPGALEPEALDTAALAFLTFNQNGSQASGTIQNNNLNGIACDGLQITNVAALYEAMLRGIITVIFETSDNQNEPYSIRGQVFVPVPMFL